MYFNQNTIIYLDNEFQKAEESLTNLYGQTLHYGYGVFEGIRAYETQAGTKIFKAKEHFERLKKSCEYIKIPFNYDIDHLIAQSYLLLEKNNFTNAYIRPLVFCGPNMNLTTPTSVSLMICAWEWGAYLGDKLLNITISSFSRPHPKSTIIEAKVCGHYVNSILASTEAKANGFDEALLLDTEGFLAEGPGANLFFQKDNKLYTPKTGNILPGITRQTVLDLCKEMNIEVVQGQYKVEDLQSADGAFLCGTAAEIIGLKSLEHNPFVKDWKDTFGKKIQNRYKNLVLEQQYVNL